MQKNKIIMLGGNQSKFSSILLLVSITLLFFLLFYSPRVSHASSNASLITETHARVPDKEEKINSDYSVIAKFNDGKTKLIYDSKQPVTNQNNVDLFFDPSDKDKGKIRGRYTNVSMHKGKSLDLQFTVMDWEKDNFGGGEYVYFTPDRIAFKQGGYQFVTVEMEYLYSDTLEPATDINGMYMTFNDLDMHQSIALTDSEMKQVEDMHAYTGTWVHSWKNGDKTHIGSVDFQNIQPYETKGWVTFLINSHKLTFDWAKNYSGGTNLASNRDYVYSPIEFDKIKATGTIYNKAKGDIPQELFEYNAEKQLQTETVPPAKTIEGKDGEVLEQSEITYPNRSYTYNIHHTVPYETSNFFYGSYNIEDEIHPMLDIEDVKVYDFVDENVTDQFDISVLDNKVVAAAKTNSLKKQGFYGRDYRIEIKVKLKDLEELYEYANGSNSFEITNTASVTVDSHSVPSNPVSTKVNLPKIEIGLKKIQIYTKKATEGLTVNLDIDLKNNDNLLYEKEMFDLELYQINDTSKQLVDTQSVSLKNIEDKIKINVPIDVLDKDSVNTYEAILTNYNNNYIRVKDDVKSIDTLGYTASEKEIHELMEKGKDVEYEGVVMTEREMGKEMVEYKEKLTLPYLDVPSVKSGYGVEISPKLIYKNDLEDPTPIEAIMLVDNKLIDSYLEYEDHNGYSLIPLSEEYVLKENKNEITQSYKLPQVYVEEKTGNLFSEEQKASNDSRIIEKLKDGGNKLYIPIWLDSLGDYEYHFKSKKPIGINQVTFNLQGKISVDAYMFGHIGSDTIDNDEILIVPVDPKNFGDGKLPEGWTEQDIKWIDSYDGNK